MNLTRRMFYTAIVLACFAGCIGKNEKKLVILHTNDTHSQIEPIAASAPRNADMGGTLRRKVLIDSLKSGNDRVILLDAGDFCQGTPYFNLFGGEVEVEMMNRLGYDAITLGNHEFDNGVAPLVAILKKAKFPIVVSNYDVSGTPLEGIVKKTLMLDKDGLKIGIIGLGIDPKSLIAKENFEGITYLDPIETANSLAKELKTQGADVVIVLSHLGFKFSDEPEKACDIMLAKNSSDIDVIIGGHTHTFLKNAHKELNREGKEVIINQVGKSGINLGRVEIVK